MAHSYVSSFMHCVFSTKGRRRFINQNLQQRLWRYIGGIAREKKMKALAIGGMEDHVHILLSLPAPMSVAKALQLIKAGSSKWIHDTFRTQQDFGWQEGYGAFSVGISQLERTVAYIREQEKHHRKKTFQEEFLAFLKKHRIEYDERYIWG